MLPVVARPGNLHAIVNLMPGTYEFDADEGPKADKDTLESNGYGDEPEVRSPPMSRRPAQEQPVYDYDFRESTQADPPPVPPDNFAEEPQEEDYQAVVTNVDRRLRIAQYFRLVLDSTLFEDGTTESRIVQNRIRKFVRDEIEVLFGMRAAAAIAASPFTQDEIDALKALAAATIVARKRSSEPKLNQIANPPPAIKPVAAPALRAIQSTAAPMPAVQQQRPQQAVARARQPAPTPPGELQGMVAPGTPSLKNDPRIPDQYKNDASVRIKNGHVFVQQRNGDGELLWAHEPGMKRPMPILKDVTPVSMPQGAVQPQPMPSIESMESLSMTLAVNNDLSNRTMLAQKWGPVLARNLGL